MNITSAAFLITHSTGQREVIAAELLTDDEIVGIVRAALLAGETIEILPKEQAAEVWRNRK